MWSTPENKQTEPSQGQSDWKKWFSGLHSLSNEAFYLDGCTSAELLFLCLKNQAGIACNGKYWALGQTYCL